MRWSGQITAVETGEYALRFTGGFARLILDGKQLGGGARGGMSPQFVTLEAGKPHQITVEMADRFGRSNGELQWSMRGRDYAAEAVEVARRADVAVLFLGLSPRLEGEEMQVQLPGFAGGDRLAIDLPKVQEDLMRAVVETGTPTVLVLLNGSALAVNWADAHVPAIVEAWYPGQAAGTAIADVLFATLIRFAGGGIAAERDFTILGVDHLGVAAVDFQRWPNTGKDQIGTAHALALQTFHPIGYAPG